MGELAASLSHSGTQYRFEAATRTGALITSLIGNSTLWRPHANVESLERIVRKQKNVFTRVAG